MAGIRMTGLISNMDTESVVKQLMEAQRTKVTKIENKKTKLEWTQDKWKDLNAKLYKLYQEQTSKLHLVSNYKTKSATSADESIVKVTADKTAADGTHSIAITQLASSQYVTGNKLNTDKNGNAITSKTKLADLSTDNSIVGTKITVKSAKGEKVIDVTESTTINDVVKACTSVGLNANYDEKQQRLFISSATSGADQAFSITSTSYTGTNTSMLAAKQNLGSIVSSSDRSSVYDALNNIESKMSILGDETAKKNFVNGILDGSITKASINSITNAAEKAAKLSIFDSVEKINTAVLNNATAKATAAVTETEKSLLKDNILDKIKNSDDGFYEVKINEGTPEEKVYRVDIPKKSELSDTYTNEDYEKMVDEAMQSTSMKELLKYNVDNNSDLANKITEEKTSAIGSMVTNLESFVSGTGATASDKLGILGIGNINVDGSGKATSSASCAVVSAADCKAIYNGAELTSSTNKITANGITFEAISVSEVSSTDPSGYKSTSITISKDTDATYKMIKDFLTEYNSILKELNDAYYADSSKGYEPLTDEEKEAMTENQITLWEDKIKKSLLRRDGTVNSITSAMKQAMQSTVEVDGKKYSLSSFGIMTSKDYTEKGLLHIYGDKDDATYADKDDKLRKAIDEDPETVAKVFAGIVDNLHSALYDKMSKTSLSSALTFYNDKQMANQVTKYKKDIKTMEDKLQEQENAYYKQFAAMEKALAALQSQQSALAGLLGTN